MYLRTSIDDSLTADFELDFTNSTWSLPPAQAKWGNVMFSDRGRFEVKNWGVIWLMDGSGATKNSAVILHSAPTGEQDAKHQAGKGFLFAPALSKYKDTEIRWKFLRASTPVQLKARTAAPLSKVRAKAKKICEDLLPKTGLTNGQKPAGVSGTGCGEFPGRVLRRMPVKGEGQFGAFSLNVPGAGVLYLTSPTTHWENFAKEIDKKYNPARKCWVEFSESKRPRPGDIYVLHKFEAAAAFQHVGVIYSAEGNEWVTADGGQGAGGGDPNQGWRSGFITRKFQSSGQMDGEMGAKAWLRGWVDLDNLRECLAKYFPQDLT